MTLNPLRGVPALVPSNPFGTSTTIPFSFRTLPVEANFYPVPTSVFIDDPNTRFTVLTGQPTGATSQSQGQLEIMLDRRLNADDGKGLSMGDAAVSPPSRLRYRLMFEKKLANATDRTEMSYHTSRSHFVWQHLMYPPEVFVGGGNVTKNGKIWGY